MTGQNLGSTWMAGPCTRKINLTCNRCVGTSPSFRTTSTRTRSSSQPTSAICSTPTYPWNTMPSTRNRLQALTTTLTTINGAICMSRKTNYKTHWTRLNNHLRSKRFLLRASAICWLRAHQLNIYPFYRSQSKPRGFLCASTPKPQWGFSATVFSLTKQKICSQPKLMHAKSTNRFTNLRKTCWMS